MKRIRQQTAAFLFLFSLTILASAQTQAQSTSRQDFEKEIIAELCDTFTKAAPNIAKENTNLELGMMLIPLFEKYESQIKKEWGFSIADEEGAQAIGEKIGQLATLNCEAFRNFIKANLKNIEKGKGEKETKTFAGTLTKIEGSPFTYLLVKNSQGRTDKFYWMEFFPGAEKLSASGVARLNKPIRISYRDVEVYKALEKDYTTIKVITQVEFR